FGAASFAFTQTSSPAAFRFIGKIADFTDRNSTWVRLVPWATMALVGVYFLTALRRREAFREAGLGLVLIGAWNTPFYLLSALGLLSTLLVDSDVASRTSRRFPADSRVLMWIGYLVLSATILGWIQVTHGEDFGAAVQRNGFSDLAIPFAAWLFIRRPWTPRE